MGPITVFDKSALQSLSIDESVWFDQFLSGNITPLFYVETLADLEKLVREGQTPEGVVGGIAVKTPLEAMPNIYHRDIFLAELVGNEVELRHVPIVAGGVPRLSPDGKTAIHFDEFPEQEALSRWRNEEFMELERSAAKEWRRQLASQDSDIVIAKLKNILPAGHRINSLESLKDFIDKFCETDSAHVLSLILDILEVPNYVRQQAMARWNATGRPVLSKFLPYTLHVFKVDLLYYLGIYRGFISGERKSNKADMAYLYYLPFCMVFLSDDKLHAKTVPLFLDGYQSYVSGKELKQSLGELNEHYKKLPDEIKEKGVIQFCVYPPSNLDNVVTRLWDKHMRPDWRVLALDQESRLLDPEYWSEPRKSAKDIIKNVDESIPLTGNNARLTTDKADQIFIKRVIPSRRGSWRTVSQEVVDAGKERRDAKAKGDNTQS